MPGRSFALSLLLALLPAVVTAAPSAPEEPLSSDRVMGSLSRTFGWYQQVRNVMRSLDSGGSAPFFREAEPNAVRILQRAFDVARAQAALLSHGSSAPASDGSEQRKPADERARLEAAIRRDEQERARLHAELQTAGPAQRAGVERRLTAANNRLELDRAHLDFVTKLGQVEASLPQADMDLGHQIQALADAVPELRSPTTPVENGPARPAGSTSGTWTSISRLLALQRARARLKTLAGATNGLTRGLEAEEQAAEANTRPIARRLRALAKDPGADGTPVAEGQREFRDLLERVKLSAAVILPLREETALVRRYEADLKSWDDALERESNQALEALGLELLGVAISLGIILVAAVLWHVATIRYVADAYRRRLFMTTRNVVVIIAVALVLVFHFTSELAALVTVLGFAAAGIAFALQNIILAVAGYFSMVAPNGIRVGDRVSLQGPFGYVHGDVVEIGFVRLKLRELAGEPLAPTGRIVVFPNSVVFTGSFFKHPSTGNTVAGPSV